MLDDKNKTYKFVKDPKIHKEIFCHSQFLWFSKQAQEILLTN